MFAKTYGATTLGIDGRIIDVEVDVSPGLPGFELVGLPDTSVKESKERVRTAIRNSGIQLRQERVTVNLAPADVRKDSSGLDLPIAVGLLASYGMVPEATVQSALFSAELSLDGNCRPMVRRLNIKPQQSELNSCHTVHSAQKRDSIRSTWTSGISLFCCKESLAIFPYPVL